MFSVNNKIHMFCLAKRNQLVLIKIFKNIFLLSTIITSRTNIYTTLFSICFVIQISECYRHVDMREVYSAYSFGFSSSDIQ